ISFSKTVGQDYQTNLRIFDIATGAEKANYDLGKDHYYSLAYSPDGKKIACGFSDRSVVLEVATGRVLYRLNDRPVTLCFSANGKYLAAYGIGCVRLWDAETGKELHEQTGSLETTMAIGVSADAQLITTAGWLDQSVTIWESATGKLVRRLPLTTGERRYIVGLSFS